jgi:nicotinamidase/pyrazinamidase
VIPKVLIIVDMQRDFMPIVESKSVPDHDRLCNDYTGCQPDCGYKTVEEMISPLPVPGGLDIVPNIVKEAYSGYDLVIATRDFHPGNHSSFKELGGPWPMHCVAGSEGAQILPEIDMVSDIIISKGTNPDENGYSGFGSVKYKTVLAPILHSLQKSGEPGAEVSICGVATDYCVKATALDCGAMGWSTTVLLDCIAGVEDETTEDALILMDSSPDITLKPRD